VPAVNRQESRQRLEARRADLRVPCKLSRIDHALLDHWHAYTETAGAMFATTHTPVAGWVVVNANDRRSARINTRHPAIVAPPDQVERSRPGVKAAERR
jgi:polyphosphate kinase 2 (PPK2 family)